METPALVRGLTFTFDLPGLGHWAVEVKVPQKVCSRLSGSRPGSPDLDQTWRPWSGDPGLETEPVG